LCIAVYFRARRGLDLVLLKFQKGQKVKFSNNCIFQPPDWVHGNEMALQRRKHPMYNPAAQPGIYHTQQLPSIYHVPEQPSNSAETTQNQRR